MPSRLAALPRREAWVVEAPTLLVSLVIAEMFYKLGSFTLEAVAMLATWWVMSTTAKWILSRRDDSES